jgi:hypothetical protein
MRRKMIKLMFSKNNQFFLITIENKVVNYWDKKEGAIWGGSLQYLPPDPNAIKKIDMSRNKIPQHFKELLRITKEDMLEFEGAKSDEELKEIIIRDCKLKGCKLPNEETKT